MTLKGDLNRIFQVFKNKEDIRENIEKEVKIAILKERLILSNLDNEILYLINEVAPNRDLGKCKKLNEIWNNFQKNRTEIFGEWEK